MSEKTARIVAYSNVAEYAIEKMLGHAQSADDANAAVREPLHTMVAALSEVRDAVAALDAIKPTYVIT